MGGMAQLRGCAKNKFGTGQGNRNWNCSNLLATEKCYRNARKEPTLCPFLRAPLDAEIAVIQNLLDLDGCSVLSGDHEEGVEVHPIMRRGIRRKEAAALQEQFETSLAQAKASLKKAMVLEKITMLNQTRERLKKARVDLARYLAVCDDNLDADAMLPTVACGGACKPFVNESTCEASSTNRTIQSECGRGMYLDPDEAGNCSHLVDRGVYKLCHRDTGYCLASTPSGRLRFSHTMFKVMAKEGFAPAAPATTWTLRKKRGSSALSFMPKAVAMQRGYEKCLAVSDMEGVSLSACAPDAQAQVGIPRACVIALTALPNFCHTVAPGFRVSCHLRSHAHFPRFPRFPRRPNGNSRRPPLRETTCSGTIWVFASALPQRKTVRRSGPQAQTTTWPRC